MPLRKIAPVPVILQMEALECGAACLAMILAYHGKWLSAEKIREDCGVSRDGSKAKNMMLAARAHGLKARGFKGEVESVRKAAFPCIIHWNFNHFVVLKGFSRGYAYINDPSGGAVKVSMKTFDKSFTGVYLTFEKTEDFMPEGKPRSVFSFAAERLRGTMAMFVFVVLTGLLSTVINMINPALSRVFMDRILTGQNPDWLMPVIIGMGLVAFASISVSLISTLYLLKIRGKLAIVANATFLWHLLRLPVSFYSQRMAGDIMDRQNVNESITDTVVSQLAPLIISFISMVFYLTIIISYSPLLTAIGLAAIFINVSVNGIVSRMQANVTRVQMRDAGKLSGYTTNGIEMIETIKSAGAEDGFFQHWSGLCAAVNTSQTDFTRVTRYLSAVPPLVSSLSSLTILVTGVFLIIQNSFTIGMLLAFQGYLGSVTGPLTNFFTVGQSFRQLRVSMERIEDVMNYEPDVEPGETPEDLSGFSKLSGEVELRNICFGYSPLEPPLIKDFNLSLSPGKSVALVGASGCGKSTLAKLISGLYKPWSGEILFDGKPLSEINRQVLTSSLSVVDQDIILFEDTVSANVRLWDNSIEDFEVIMACRDAGIHNDILGRPGGYRNLVAENGKNFSGGQRQRLEVARALAGDPTILIMDEATSALDAKTELDMMEYIRDREITCIIIAHRLSTIRDCDEIVVIDKGEVVERGTHGELIKADGLYTRLVTTE